MCHPNEPVGCPSLMQMHRRRMLQSTSGLLGATWLTSLAEHLARASERTPVKQKARSLLILWLQGGPSQLETWDPHPGTRIGGDVTAIDTTVPGLQIASTLPKVAQQMHRTTLIRSMVSKEGDHERATYNLKTGWRPDPTLVHPSIGAIVCHQTQDNLEIPRHVSILGSEWPARGGYLGNDLDAFKIGDPREPLPNLKSDQPEKRQRERLSGLAVLENQFVRGRLQDLDRAKTLHQTSTQRAVQMMSSQQIAAFDIAQESQATLRNFGDTSFGRGCLAGVRLIETGVRCVEVELSGWDSHINNHVLQSGRCEILDSALAATLEELAARELLEHTVVLCGGEFGRTPTINPAGGRDHWPTGFSVLLAGGGFRSGMVYGETSADPDEGPENRLKQVIQPVRPEDLHATILAALGVDSQIELKTPIGRPMFLSQGRVLHELFS